MRCTTAGHFGSLVREHIHGDYCIALKPTAPVVSGQSTRPQGIQRIMLGTFGVPWIAVHMQAATRRICTGTEPCTNMILH